MLVLLIQLLYSFQIKAIVLEDNNILCCKIRLQLATLDISMRHQPGQTSRRYSSFEVLLRSAFEGQSQGGCSISSRQQAAASPCSAAWASMMFCIITKL